MMMVAIKLLLSVLIAVAVVVGALCTYHAIVSSLSPGKIMTTIIANMSFGDFVRFSCLTAPICAITFDAVSTLFHRLQLESPSREFEILGGSEGTSGEPISRFSKWVIVYPLAALGFLMMFILGTNVSG
jgi:hypothetical protein